MIVTRSTPAEKAAAVESPAWAARSAFGTMARGLAREFEDPRRRAFWAGWAFTFFYASARIRARGLAAPLATILMAELGGQAAAKAWELVHEAHATAEAVQTIAAAHKTATESALGRDQ